MSESANLDLGRAILAGLERGDFFSVLDRWADPQIEWVVVDGPARVRLKGVSAVVGWMRDFLSAWEGLRVVADEYRALDDERVLVLVHVGAGRGRTSGLELGQHGGGGAQIFHFAAGKGTRHVIYFNRERALAELGLAPEADSAT
jgi:hypothetical protein